MRSSVFSDDRQLRELQRRAYALICRSDGIKAREIARQLGVARSDINQILYGAPFIRELCYRDEAFCWHGLIRQARPHIGLGDFCGYYGTADRFLRQTEDEWLEELLAGCRSVGRNLNDTRGLLHSFRDTREVMRDLFRDLEPLHCGNWELCFELRIHRARCVRIYADVLVITENRVFSLEFKMKDVIDPAEELQAIKYANYLDILFGESYEVIPALVLTRAEELYTWQTIPGSTAQLPVCSGDMLFNLFDEYIGFLH